MPTQLIGLFGSPRRQGPDGSGTGSSRAGGQVGSRPAEPMWPLPLEAFYGQGIFTPHWYKLPHTQTGTLTLASLERSLTALVLG